jgi:DNA-binding response OmpR family regulator
MMARVLVIDDEMMVCQLLLSIVERLGHEFYAATTYRVGLKEALARAFDIVHLDVHVPDVTVAGSCRRYENSP